MKKVNFDVKLPAFVERIVYVDNYGARPYCYTIEDASRNADAVCELMILIKQLVGSMSKRVLRTDRLWLTIL